MRLPRLRPGCSVFTVEGRGTVLRDAEGQMFDIALPDETVRSALTGAETEALEAFRKAGHLGERAAWPADRARVVVLADESAALCDALRHAGAEPVAASAHSTVAEIDRKSVV